MKLGELIKNCGYDIIDDNIDSNLRKFIMNLDLESKMNEESFLQRFSKYKIGDVERDFIIETLNKNYRYESYKYTYLEWVNFRIKDYTKEHIDSLEDIFDIDIERLTDGEVYESDIVDGIEDIDKIIDLFKQNLIPPLDVDSVYDELSNIFESVVGEARGFLQDENGVWYKFGKDPYKDVELLTIKYPSLKESIEDENTMEIFVEYIEMMGIEILENKSLLDSWI